LRPELEKRNIYRWTAAGFLWFVIILAFFLSLRSAAVVGRIAAGVEGKTITSQDEKMISEAREVSRAFAVEWATWSGDPAEYAKRMSIFFGSNTLTASPPSAGKQMVVSSSIFGERNIGKTKNIDVLLHVRRLYTVEKENNTKITEWRDGVMLIEIPVKASPKRAIICGMPIVKPLKTVQSNIERENFSGKTPDPNLESFVKQFLELYYKGEKIDNFVISESGLYSLGGWKVDSVDQMQMDDQNQTVYVKIRISTNNVIGMEQEVCLKISNKEKRYYVEDIYPYSF